jgi:endonuclease G
MSPLLKVLPFFFLLSLSCAHGANHPPVPPDSALDSGSEFRITRKFYELSYNPDHKVANWVSYSLETSQLKDCVKRNDAFKPDPLILTGSPQLADYKGSGFDRGHMLPAGDMKFDAEAMRDTFYLSNIAPQPPSFNRGFWAHLEALVRAWAQKYEKIWIVTGPILHPGLPQIGKKNLISVPEEFYKVIIRKEGSSYKGIGFLVKTVLPWPTPVAYSVEIDQVERESGQDFFPFLSSSQEPETEGHVDQNDWDFTASFEYLPCSP